MNPSLNIMQRPSDAQPMNVICIDKKGLDLTKSRWLKIMLTSKFLRQENGIEPSFFRQENGIEPSFFFLTLLLKPTY